jgi:hypothetical protein
MISKGLRQVIEDWYVLKTYGKVYENLHRDIQADINHYFDVTGNYGQVLSNNDWVALCKEWLNIDIKISHYKDNKYRKGWVEVTLNYDSSSVFANKGFEANTEPEAIFQACQWILDQKEN